MKPDILNSNPSVSELFKPASAPNISVIRRLFFLTGLMILLAGVTFARDTTDMGRKQGKEQKREARKQKHKFRKSEALNEVSNFTRAQFAIDFPNAINVQYSKTKNFDEVAFMNEGKQEKAFYDASNTLVGTTTQIRFVDLPPASQNEIEKKYPGYDVTTVIKFDDNEANSTDMMLYELSFQDEDSYFAALKKDNKEIVLQIDMGGAVSFFTDIK